MRLATKLVFSLFLLTSISFSQTKYTWNGSSGSWQTATSWIPNGIPGPADTAVINSGTVTNDLAVTVASIFHKNGTITGAGDFLIINHFVFESGTHSGTGTTTLAAGSTGDLATSFSKTLSRTLTIDGSLIVSGSGSLVFSSGAQLINNGTIDMQNNNSLGSASGTIINNGSFIRSVQTGTATIAAPFSNNGIIEILTGTLALSSSSNNALTGEIKGVGTLSPTGNFTNDGTFSPGTSPGVLRIQGSYPQSSNGNLNIEIGGYLAGNERDSLSVSGQANLNGTLNVQFINNFIPSLGDSFMVMSYGSRVGQFSQIVLSNNVTAQAQYKSNGLQLKITNNGSNLPPVAVNDLAETNEDTPKTLNVLINDSDPDGDPVSILSFTQPLHGNAVQSGDSSITYSPNPNFFGQDSLTYTIQDPLGATSTAKVFFTVLPVNDPPTVPALLLPVNGDTLNPSPSINFVWNSSYDVENNPLTYSLRIWGGSLDTTVAGLTDTTFAFNNPNAFQQNNVYQWQVAASDGNLSTLSAIRNFYLASTTMAGIYTIGAGGDFNTINEAVTALKTFGVAGAVTLNILPGIYDEQVIIDSINGLAPTSPLVIQSQSLNPEDVIWKYSGQAPNSNFVLLLREISHITVKSISFIAAKTTAGRLVGIGANSSNIVIENNNLTGVSTASTTNVYAVINAHNATIDNIQIIGNKINFGSFAVHLFGFVSQQVSNVTIENNECLGQSFVSIWILNASVVQINNNIIDNGVQLGGGIILNDSYLPISISGNKITTNKWGISLNFNTAGNGEFLVANNFLEVNAPKNNNYPPFAIRSGSNAGISFFYNTLLVVGDTVENSSALWIESPISVQKIKNNILVNTARGKALNYFGTIGIESDFNDLFSEGNTLVTWNSSNYSDLASYQAARGQDLNSLNINPSFLSSNDPHLNDFILNNAGTPLAEVTTDIDGEPRHPGAPDIGADEFEPQGFEGEFTIGDGGDFPTITAAVQTLGDTIVTGPIIFKILTGVYVESVVLTKFPGVSASNYLVFESATGNKSDVIWNYDQYDVANLIMSGARHIKIRNLTFTRTTNHGPLAEFSILPSLEDSCSNILLEGNEFIGVYADPGTSFRLGLLTSKFNNYLDSVIVVNNIFRKGLVAIEFSASESLGLGIVIENNLIEEPTQYGITLYQLNAPRVIKNEVRMLTSPAGKQFREGISVAACNGKLEILNNRVTINLVGTIANSSVTGIEIFACNGNTTRGLVANNFVRVNFQSSAHTNYTGKGITLFTSKNQDVLFNTIRVGGGLTASSSKALYFLFGEGNHRLQNNISVNLAGGYALWVEGSSLPLNQSDYNNFLSSGSNLVRWGNTDYSNLASYQTGTGKDLNSLSADPLFVSSDDLHIKSGSPVDGKGTPLAEVPRDIDNQPRSLTTPDIGADEYTQQRIIIKRRNNLKQNIAQGNNRDSIYIDPRLESMMSGYTLVDVNVFIDTLFHTNLADLEISLLHNGMTDTLANFLPDSSSGFINTVLDDSASTDLSDGVSPFTGFYRPYSPLSVFNGIDPEGDWILLVYDRSSNNSGILDAWGIELVFEIATDVEDNEEITVLPDNFELSQNYPNPFNPSTTIRYSVPERSNVVLKIYDILGREVSTLVNENKDAGIYTINFNASQLASGIYLYQLKAGEFIQTRKMLLIK